MGISNIANAIVKPSTLLSGSHNRLTSLNGELADLVARIGNLGDRAVGPLPPNETAKGGDPREVRSGAHGAIQDQLDVMSRHLDSGRKLLERVEGFI
jgi:hypothetical protein